MDRQTSTQRTRAAVAMALLLFVGLCSFVVGGPLQAGAQPPEAPPLPAFAESEPFSFADRGWLGLVADFAPASAFGFEAADSTSKGAPAAPTASDTALSGDSEETPSVETDEETPSVETDYVVTNCQAAPTLAVTYTIAAPKGLREVSLFGLVGLDVVEPTVKFKRGDTSLTFTENVDLGPATTLWDLASMSIVVVDAKGNTVDSSLELIIDFDSCTAQVVLSDDAFDGEVPVVELDTPVLSSCDAAPKLTLAYTVTADNGIASTELDGLNGDEYVNIVHEFDGKSTTLERTEELSLDHMLAQEELDVFVMTEVSLSVTAYDRDGRVGYVGLSVDVNIADCTLSSFNLDVPETGGDTDPGNGLPDDHDDDNYDDDGESPGAPSVEIVSIEITACDDTTPVVSIGYTISDEDGIVEARASILEAVEASSLDLPGASDGRKELTGELTVPINLFGQPNVDTWFSFKAVDSTGRGGWSDFNVQIDLDSCTVDF